MISVFINGEEQHITTIMPLSEVVPHWGPVEQLVAVAVNDNFISRSEYQNTIINDGDRIEIVSPMQGG